MSYDLSKNVSQGHSVPNGEGALKMFQRSLPHQWVIFQNFLVTKSDATPDDLKSTWNQALNEIPKKRVIVGVKHYMQTRDCKFFPNNPFDVANVCREITPEQLGFTSTSKAFREAQKNIQSPRQGDVWSNPAVHEASKFIPNVQHAFSPVEIFKEKYLKCVDMLLTGELQFEQIPVKVTLRHEVTEETKLKRSEELKKLKELLND